MMKICDKTLVHPLNIIFKASIQESVFLDYWKKYNVVPFHQLAFFQFLAKYTTESFLKTF